MNWEHEETTLDGTKIFKPGTLVKVDLTQHMLIDAESPVVDPNRWISVNSTNVVAQEYGMHPVVMILDLDPLENYYQISLGEKAYWFPLFCTYPSDTVLNSTFGSNSIYE